MIVVDASVLAEVVIDGPAAERLRARLAADDDHLAPELIDAEVLAVIESHHRGGLIDLTAAALAIRDLRTWPGERWPLAPLIGRCWELRDNVRAYDAFYVALAEQLGAPLMTLDAKLRAAPGPRCAIELL